MREITSLISGSPSSPSASAEQIKIENPRDESINGVLFEADAAEVDVAVTVAREAFDSCQ